MRLRCPALAICVTMVATGASAQTASRSTAPLANEAFEVLDCNDAGSIFGSSAFVIKRDRDGAFIGLVAWHADPDPRAHLHLVQGWCGPGCAEIALASDSWLGEAFPTRFYEGPTNGPSLTFIIENCALDHEPIDIRSSDGHVTARITDFDKTSTESISNAPKD